MTSRPLNNLCMTTEHTLGGHCLWISYAQAIDKRGIRPSFQTISGCNGQVDRTMQNYRRGESESSRMWRSHCPPTRTFGSHLQNDAKRSRHHYSIRSWKPMDGIWLSRSKSPETMGCFCLGSHRSPQSQGRTSMVRGLQGDCKEK